MKVESYSICSPNFVNRKQYMVVGEFGVEIRPLIYLQRPKWITDDELWNKLVNSLQLSIDRTWEFK